MRSAVGIPNIAYGVTWGERKRPRLFGAWAVAVSVALLAMSLSSPQQAEVAATVDRIVSVIVRELPGAGSAPEAAVQAAGGSVGRHIKLIDGFVAGVPEGSLDALRSSSGVHSVTLNGKVTLLESKGASEAAYTGEMQNVAEIIGADDVWAAGFTGEGVDVALIDSGVAPVEGLLGADKIVNGPDLSFEGSFPEVRYLDTFGHGTHMAGIIAGNDGVEGGFTGVAPDARIVSVKVANNEGATDVSQVLAGIDWAVQHRNDDGLNIRVLNLSFGTDAIQPYVIDPLSFAVEAAWRKGIVVVVAGGNEGYGTIQLNNPALNPTILAVGGSDPLGTMDTKDDIVADFSSRGNALRGPDLLAPGKSVVSLRDPGSFIDEMYPAGRVGDRFFRGSGTSQSAAVVSGAAALLLQQRPELTPDQVKRLLEVSAVTLKRSPPQQQGAGQINLESAMDQRTPTTWESRQWNLPATGLGSLELSRGSAHVTDEDGNDLTGEQTIFGDRWDGRTWSGRTWSGNTWSGGDWMGRTWSGNTWSNDSWAGRTWSGVTWSGRTWSGNTWSGRTWSGRTWSGNTWSGVTWSGRTWSGVTWSGRTWSGNTWSGNTWSGSAWE
ncbi:MAG: S8 family serine peptidase [Actinobacteria bacterium]|nr:S8 family serine peptidase [Actinomycetota bacterium]